MIDGRTLSRRGSSGASSARPGAAWLMSRLTGDAVLQRLTWLPMPAPTACGRLGICTSRFSATQVSNCERPVTPLREPLQTTGSIQSISETALLQLR
jgi:hypothetical protein